MYPWFGRGLLENHISMLDNGTDETAFIFLTYYFSLIH